MPEYFGNISEKEELMKSKISHVVTVVAVLVILFAIKITPAKGADAEGTVCGKRTVCQVEGIEWSWGMWNRFRCNVRVEGLFDLQYWCLRGYDGRTFTCVHAPTTVSIFTYEVRTPEAVVDIPSGTPGAEGKACRAVIASIPACTYRPPN